MDDAYDMESNSQSPDLIRTEDGVLVRKLYIGNVPHIVNKKALQDIFGQFGKIQNVFIKRSLNDQKSAMYNGKRDTFGFITYYEPESATKALNYHRTINLQYKRLKVKRADTWHQPIELPDGQVKFDNGETIPSSTSFIKLQDSQQLDDEESLLGAVGGVGKLPIKEGTDSNACNIEMLNEYCLLHIFSYMSIFDHLKMEKVCRRWFELFEKNWNNKTILDIDKIIKNKISIDTILTTDMLRKLLIKFGENLIHVKLTSTNHNLNLRTHRVISQYCKNLEILDLSGMSSTGNSIGFIARNCNKLRKIYFKDISGVHDNVFEELFVNNQNLESVSLDRNFAMTGKCLRHLTSKLRELKLIHCNSLKLVDLRAGLRKTISLESLSLDSCVTITSNVLAEIVILLPNLKSLSLNNYYPLMNSESLRPVEMLKQLTYLSLSMNQAVNNNILQIICDSCQELEELDISGCGLQDNIDRNGILLPNTSSFQHVARLPKLYDLTINYTDIVNAESIMNLASRGILRILKVRGCPNFDDNTALKLLQKCPNLTYLDMSGCEKITENTIINAINILKLQSGRVQQLKFVIGGTSIQTGSQHHPMLDISRDNYCLHHFRPDYSDDYFPSDEVDEFEFDDYYDPNDVDCVDDFDNWRQYLDDTVSDFEEDEDNDVSEDY